MKLTQELIDKQLSAKGFSSNSGPIKRLSDPIQDTPMLVTLDQLQPYEHNPRKSRNPLYDDIKSSIRSRGLDQPPLITRRPGEDHFIIRNGGNTRLEILGELWRETKDQRFYKIHCLFKPWESEINALAGHLAENELHGQLSFIEKARGIAHIKALYEERDGEDLSLRKLAERLKEDGYPVSTGLLSHMLDCVNSILPAMPNTLMQGLSRVQVARLLKLKNSLGKVWGKYDQSDFLDFWIMVLSGQDNGVDAFRFEIIQDELLSQMSVMLGQEYGALELDLAVEDGGTVNTAPISGEQVAAINGNPPVPAPSSNSNNETVEPENDTSPQQQTPLVQQPEALEVAARTQPEKSEASQQHQPDAPSPASSSSVDREEDPQGFIDGHVVSPSQESATLRRTRQLVAEANGENLRDFEDAVLESIPVMAGGANYTVADVWYIEQRMRDVDSLRHNIWLLVSDICHTTGVTGFMQTREGLGFGMNSDLGNDGSALSLGMQLFFISLLRMGVEVESTETPAPLAEALIGQLLMGTYDITIGHSAAQNIGLVRLPDTELVKLFRVIRLIRSLVDRLNDQTED